MLTLTDCLDFCPLPADVVEAIAARERVPVMVAAQIGSDLADRPQGTRTIQLYILQEIAAAMELGDRDRRLRLEGTLARFRKQMTIC